jgi:hypothetical protein
MEARRFSETLTFVYQSTHYRIIGDWTPQTLTYVTNQEISLVFCEPKDPLPCYSKPEEYIPYSDTVLVYDPF